MNPGSFLWFLAIQTGNPGDNSLYEYLYACVQAQEGFMSFSPALVDIKLMYIDV